MTIDVNTEVSMQRLAEEAGIKLKGKGSVLTGTCPFHVRSSPTITIDTISNTWACRTCRVSDGSPTTFTMRSKNVSRKLAIELLRAEMGGGVVIEKKRKLPSVITTAVEDEKLWDQIVTYYRDTLKRDQKAQEFLMSSGIRDSGVIDAFKVGVSDRTLGYRLPDRQVKAGREIRERLIRIGILRDSGHETLRGCVTIPLHDATGNITGIYGRRLKIDTRKTDIPDVYVGTGLVNTAAATASNELVLTITPFEALVAWSSGVRNVTVVMPGSVDTLMATITNVSKIVLLLPRTKEGDDQVTAFTETLKKASPKVEVFRALLPHGMDAVQAETASPGSIPEVIRTAEWLAGVRSTTMPVTLEPKVVIEDAQTSEPEKTTTAATTGDVTIDIGDRRWRIRGMQ